MRVQRRKIGTGASGKAGFEGAGVRPVRSLLRVIQN